MNSRFLLLLSGLLLGACGSEPDSSGSGSASPNPDETTTPTDSLYSIQQQRGEPGIPGSDIPDDYWVMADGACYAYGSRVVRVGRSGAGEVVAVFSAGDRAQCDASVAQAVFSTDTGGDPEVFFGIVDDLLLLERATDEEHLIRVVDLGSGSVVHETSYEEPVDIREGGLFYGEPAEEFESQEGLDAVGVDCPESGAWFEDSLAIGVSIRSRFDLSTREVELTDEVTCIPLL